MRLTAIISIEEPKAKEEVQYKPGGRPPRPSPKPRLSFLTYLNSDTEINLHGFPRIAPF
jgi:hypothetical protein